MELGDFGLRWIRFMPEFGGNKDLPPDQQLSLEIERMRTAEVIALAGSDDQKNRKWLDSEKMQRWSNDPEFGPILLQYDLPTLAVFRQFVERTRGFKNFFFDGRESDDPAEIFLKSPYELTNEITLAIVAASRLTGDLLKKFVALCDGSSSATGAPPAPEGAPSKSASTPAAPTGP